MRFGFLRHAIGTNWRDLCTTLHIMRAQWWPCAQLFPVPLLGKPFLGRGHALVFPVFKWRLVIKRVAWYFLLFFLNFLCSALSVALWPCFLFYPFVRWFTLFGDAAFLVLCHPGVVLRFLNIASASHQVQRQVFGAAQRGRRGHRSRLEMLGTVQELLNAYNFQVEILYSCVFFPDVSWHFMILWAQM